MNFENLPDLAKSQFGVIIPAIILNMALISVTLAVKRFRTCTTYWYIIQIAIAQLCVVVPLIFNFIQKVNFKWTFSVGVCKTNQGALMTGIYGSALFVMLLSVDRYLATHKRKSKLRTLSGVIIISSSLWVIAVIASSPMFRYSAIRGYEPYCTCSQSFPGLTRKERCELEGFTDLASCPISDDTDDSPTCISRITPTQDDIDLSSYDLSQYFYGGSEIDDYIAWYGNSSGISTFEFYGLPDISTEVPTTAIPTTLYTDGLSQNFNRTPYCHFWNLGLSFKAYLVFNFVAMFLMPVLIGIIFIIVTSVQNKEDGTKISSTFLLNVMSLVLSILLLCFWLPFHVLNMIKIGVGIYVEKCFFFPGIVINVGSAFSIAFPLVVFCFIIASAVLGNNEESSLA